MSPPEVWGPAAWNLFHSLAEKIHPDAYPKLAPSLFGMIQRICGVLPCPECSKDATRFLANIKIQEYKTKTEFKNMLYLFHNWVNAKKRKPLYNYSNMNKYERAIMVPIINNFLSKCNTKGNMKLLTESFQRNFVFKDFIYWFKLNSAAFYTLPIPPRIVDSQSKPKIAAKEDNNSKIEEKDEKDNKDNKELDIDIKLSDSDSEIEIIEFENDPIKIQKKELSEIKSTNQKKKRNKSKK